MKMISPLFIIQVSSLAFEQLGFKHYPSSSFILITTIKCNQDYFVLHQWCSEAAGVDLSLPLSGALGCPLSERMC